MKLSLISILIFIGAIFGNCTHKQNRFYVAPNGNDNNPGTIEQPFLQKYIDILIKN